MEIHGVLLYCLLTASACSTHCAAKRTMAPIHTIHRSRLKVVRKADSSNTQPYVSSPFSLPPFDSLPPVPLPDNSSPFCSYPPLPPLPPSVTIPSPALPPGGGGSGGGGSSSPPALTPGGGASFSPPAPVTIPTPAVNPGEGGGGGGGGGSSSPPALTPGGGASFSPPAPVFPAPAVTPGGGGSFSPPAPVTVPAPSLTPGGGGGGSSPAPPFYVPPIIPITPTPVVDPPYFLPSPPAYFPAPGGGGTHPGPFKPPIVYPPPSVPPPPSGGVGMALWCVAKPSVPDPIIQEAMNYACGSGADCSSLQAAGSCFEPDTLFAHASYAFNSYWQRTKIAGGTCSFGGTAILVTVDPSHDGCHFLYL